MKKERCLYKRYFFLLALLLFLLVFSFMVSAQEGVLQSVFNALAGENFDMAEGYSQYNSFIDFIIYVIFFVGISQVALRKQFKERAGKSVIIVVGVALAIALAIWGKANDFNLTKIGPIAALIFILVFFLLLYNIIRTLLGVELEKKAKAVLAAIVISWYLTKAIAPAFIEWVKKIPILGPLINAFIAVCLVVLIILLIMNLIALFRGGGNPPPPPPPPPGSFRIVIHSPQNGEHYAVGATINFNATVENGRDPIQWMVVLLPNVVLGQGGGRNISFSRRDLPEGTHDIYFRAVDSGGDTTESGVRIHIGEVPPGGTAASGASAASASAAAASATTTGTGGNRGRGGREIDELKRELNILKDPYKYKSKKSYGSFAAELITNTFVIGEDNLKLKSVYGYIVELYRIREKLLARGIRNHPTHLADFTNYFNQAVNAGNILRGYEELARRIREILRQNKIDKINGQKVAHFIDHPPNQAAVVIKAEIEIFMNNYYMFFDAIIKIKEIAKGYI